ncbi:hypothetical protein BG000_009468 [Podila horticola]|nr:hypothetical protein BG000_009468 [Podila horticola]
MVSQSKRCRGFRCRIQHRLLNKNGQGVEQDYRKALEWYHKASHANNTDAVFNNGCFYEDDHDVEQDKGKAMDWFHKPSDAGNADAMYHIRIMYNIGFGVEQNCGSAMEWV